MHSLLRSFNIIKMNWRKFTGFSRLTRWSWCGSNPSCTQLRIGILHKKFRELGLASLSSERFLSIDKWREKSGSI